MNKYSLNYNIYNTIKNTRNTNIINKAIGDRIIYNIKGKKKYRSLRAISSNIDINKHNRRNSCDPVRDIEITQTNIRNKGMLYYILRCIGDRLDDFYHHLSEFDSEYYKKSNYQLYFNILSNPYYHRSDKMESHIYEIEKQVQTVIIILYNDLLPHLDIYENKLLTKSFRNYIINIYTSQIYDKYLSE